MGMNLSEFEEKCKFYMIRRSYKKRRLDRPMVEYCATAGGTREAAQQYNFEDAEELCEIVAEYPDLESYIEALEEIAWKHDYLNPDEIMLFMVSLSHWSIEAKEAGQKHNKYSATIRRLHRLALLSLTARRKFEDLERSILRAKQYALEADLKYGVDR